MGRALALRPLARPDPTTDAPDPILAAPDISLTAVGTPMRRADRLVAGACYVLSWFSFAVAALTLWPLAARMAGAMAGHRASGSAVIAVLVPVIWAVIGIALRRVAKAASAGGGGGSR